MPRPSATDIAGRLLVLARCVEWENSAPEERAELAAAGDAEAQLRVAALRAGGLWEHATPAEKRFLSASPLRADERARVDASWSLEALTPLAWALGLIEDLPGYDALVSPELLGEFPDERAPELAARSRLRPTAEVDRARAVAELWLWRSRTRELIEARTPPPRGFRSFDEIVRKAASNAHRNGFLSELIEGDFALLGRAYRDLEPAQFATARSLSIERLRACNWLCGRAPQNRWADTPLDS